MSEESAVTAEVTVAEGVDAGTDGYWCGGPVGRIVDAEPAYAVFALPPERLVPVNFCDAAADRQDIPVNSAAPRLPAHNDVILISVLVAAAVLFACVLIWLPVSSPHVPNQVTEERGWFGAAWDWVNSWF